MSFLKDLFVGFGCESNCELRCISIEDRHFSTVRYFEGLREQNSCRKD